MSLAEQTLHPVGLGCRHDRAAVRERGQRRQGAAAVQHVQVRVVRSHLGRQAAGQGSQHGAAARLGCPRDQQVAAAGDVEDGRDLPLLVWPVQQAVTQPQRVRRRLPSCGEPGRGQRPRAAAAPTATAGEPARPAPRP